MKKALLLLFPFLSITLFPCSNNDDKIKEAKAREGINFIPKSIEPIEEYANTDDNLLDGVLIKRNQNILETSMSVLYFSKNLSICTCFVLLNIAFT